MFCGSCFPDLEDKHNMMKLLAHTILSTTSQCDYTKEDICCWLRQRNPLIILVCPLWEHMVEEILEPETDFMRHTRKVKDKKYYVIKENNPIRQSVLQEMRQHFNAQPSSQAHTYYPAQTYASAHNYVPVHNYVPYYTYAPAYIYASAQAPIHASIQAQFHPPSIVYTPAYALSQPCMPFYAPGSTPPTQDTSQTVLPANSQNPTKSRYYAQVPGYEL